MSREAIYTDAPANEAVRLLRAIPEPLAGLAKRLDATRAAAHSWRQGTRTPNPSTRAKMARAYGIPTDAWDRPPEATPPPPLVAANTAETTANPPGDIDPASLSNLEAVHRLLREIRSAAAAADISPTTREKLAASELKALRFRHEIEMRDLLTQDRIVAQHKEWRVVRERLAYVVGGCERCARLVTEALVELGI
jgi:transcriptional regulator with XRE-family HTH domain